MKVNITINNKQVEAEINEEELRAALGETVGFRLGEMYWFVDGQNEVEVDEWADDAIDNARLKAHNAFKTKAEAHPEKMRRESMNSRYEFAPKPGEMVWYWNFRINESSSQLFQWSILPDWVIGSVKKTKEECGAWGAKYAEYFKLPR